MPNVSASLIEDDRNKSNLGNAGGDQYDATSVKAALHSYKQTHALIGCLNKLLFFLFFLFRVMRINERAGYDTIHSSGKSWNYRREHCADFS